MSKLYLASGSPRRIELLKNLGIQFEVIKPLWETRVYSEDPVEVATLTALEKARSVQGYVEEGLILAVDTIVVAEDGEILMKPKNRAEAERFLRKLSGSVHRVISGVAVKQRPSNMELTDFEITEVKFRELLEEEISCYISTGEPDDKAGGYGIQGKGSLFVEWIRGDYFNVVGLPVRKIYEMIKEVEPSLARQFLGCK